MIRINLIRVERRKEKKPSAIAFSPNEVTKQLGFIAIFLVTISIAGFLWLDIQMKKSALQDEVRMATIERDRLKSIKDLVDRLEAERAKLVQRLEVLSDLKNNLRTPLYSLSFVYFAYQANQNVFLNSVVQRPGDYNNITISGEATKENLNKFSETLRSEPIVESLNIVSQVGEVFQITVRFRPLQSMRGPTAAEGEGEQAAGATETASGGGMK